MSKQEIIIVADYTDDARLTISQVCEICHTSPAIVQKLVDHDIVQLENDQITMQQLNRIQRSLRLKKDLEINFLGIGIILDLLDDVKAMEAEINLFKKHYR